MSDEPMMPNTTQEPMPDHVPTPRTASIARRSKTWIVFALVIVAAAAAGGLVLWNAYTRSPQYSFTRMTEAARSGDWDGVERYMVTGEVASNLLDVGWSEYVRQNPGAIDSLKQALGDPASVVAALITPMKPTLAAQMESEFRNAVETPRAGGADALTDFLFADKLKKATLITKSEAIVRVSLPTQNGSARDIRLHMKRADDHWRIVVVEDSGSVASLARRWQIAFSAAGL